MIEPAFELAWDYVCPFARNASMATLAWSRRHGMAVAFRQFGIRGHFCVPRPGA
jgi:hypothetical protein